MEHVPEREQLRGRVFPLYPAAAAPESILLGQQSGIESGRFHARLLLRDRWLLRSSKATRNILLTAACGIITLIATDSIKGQSNN
jgi:hypothetical protein